VSVYVFTGPTIPPAEAGRDFKAIYLPPAAEGDVYRAALRRPHAIGIIDGYFQSVPTVRHKEILWAMSQGIHVFGSASIGALRAAELASFGMEGVGSIFKMYHDGTLEDDDEVAVAHGPADLGYPATSEAMVNIRQTLRKAEEHTLISPELQAQLVAIGKELFYPDRNYRLILHRAFERGVSETELRRLEKWLARNRVNQKRQDAVAMLRLMRRRLANGLRPKEISYAFQHTVMWESAAQQSGKLRFDSNAPPSVIRIEALLDELRLKVPQYDQLKLLARDRFLTIREADRLRVTVGPTRRKKTEIEFRRQRNLVTAAQLARWLRDNDLEDHEFQALITEEAQAQWIQQRARVASLSYIPQQLRLSGIYPALVARATSKDRLLRSMGLQNSSVKDAGLMKNELWRWYFKKILKQPIPKDVGDYARALGYYSRDAFRRALLKEYLYRRFSHRVEKKR
jgi:hypothetical protein